jgi:molecular chaperone DnaK
LRLDDPASIARRAANLEAWMIDLERSLLDFVPSSAQEVRAFQVAERGRLLAALRDKVRDPLDALEDELDEEPAAVHEVRRLLDPVSSELSRIETALEPLPSLGLVTGRGRS